MARSCADRNTNSPVATGGWIASLPLITPVLLTLLVAGLFAPVTAAATKQPENESVVVGKVTDTAEQPLGGIRVTVTSELAAAFTLETITDEKGMFTLRISDPQGDYFVRLEGEGYASFESKTPVEAGVQVTLGIELLDAAAGRRQEAAKAFNTGVRSFNEQDYVAAKTSFLDALEHDPELTEAHQGLAEIYFKERNLQEAATSAERVLADKPDDPDVLSLAYLIHRELGNEERTEELIDALAKTDKAKPLAVQIYNQGVAALGDDDPSRAVERFRRASAIDPDLVPAYSGEASLLYNQERYDEALEALEKLFALDADNVQGRRIQYLIYDALADQPMAAQALEAYLAIDTDGAIDVMYQRAHLDFLDGNNATAIPVLERILELRPDMARAHYTLGLCYTSTDEAKAKIHLEKFVELAPDDAEVPAAREMLSLL